MEDLIDSLTNGSIGAGIATVVTYFFTRRKNIAESVKSELDNIEKVATLWRKTSEDLAQELEKQKKQFAEQSKTILDLQEKITVLSTKLNKQEEEITELNIEIKKLRAENASYKAAVPFAPQTSKKRTPKPTA